MQRRHENAEKEGSQGPRQSSAYLLALARLDEIIAAQRKGQPGRACEGGGTAQAAEVQTLPDGNHGDNLGGLAK